MIRSVQKETEHMQMNCSQGLTPFLSRVCQRSGRSIEGFSSHGSAFAFTCHPPLYDLDNSTGRPSYEGETISKSSLGYSSHFNRDAASAMLLEEGTLEYQLVRPSFRSSSALCSNRLKLWRIGE